MHCAVYQAPCRGRCAKCQTPLCATHKPSSSCAKCLFCQRRSRIPGPQPYLAASIPASNMPSVSSVSLTDLALMSRSLPDQLAWIADRRARLRHKQSRERSYLDRRASRGTHTPTDDAYEADQVLEQELLLALDVLETCLQKDVYGTSGVDDTYSGDTSFLFPDPDRRGKLQP